MDVTTTGFAHEALLYADTDDFLGGVIPFIRAGLEAGEPVLAALGRDKIALVREALGDDGGAVRFADMALLGANPARIIPAWRDFVDERPGMPVRGIGEPIWAERSPAELVECQHHESLLNVAFADRDGFALLCPYDTSTLDDAVIAEAHRSHPTMVSAGGRRPSAGYCAEAVEHLDVPLPAPPDPQPEWGFALEELHLIREFVSAQARLGGLDPMRTRDLSTAVSEVASNSIRHGGGQGIVRAWLTEDALVCEIRDEGELDDPLAGRVLPQHGEVGGWGLWLANQLCDLVQLRNTPSGTIVRLHMARA
jgi:anti-sigma regulatory factor (Ser/Thr protein kinase)